MKIYAPARIFFSSLIILVNIFSALPALAADNNLPDGTPLLFPETGHSLAYSFKSFWMKNGGLPVFGYPLTEVFNEGVCYPVF